MKTKTCILILLSILMISSLSALDILKNSEKKLYMGVGGSSSSASGSLKSSSKAMYSINLGAMLSVPLKKHLEIDGELQYALRQIYREFDHPEAYVYETVAEVQSHSLRLPLSLVFAENKAGRRGLYLGAGMAVGMNLHSTLMKEKRYNDSRPRQWENITEDMEHLGLAQFAKIGFGGKRTSLELRFSHDLSSFQIVGFEAQKLKIYDLIMIWGFKI